MHLGGPPTDGRAAPSGTRQSAYRPTADNSGVRVTTWVPLAWVHACPQLVGCALGESTAERLGIVPSAAVTRAGPVQAEAGEDSCVTPRAWPLTTCQTSARA